MNFGRIVAAGVTAWLVSLPVGYVVNEILLKEMFVANAAAFRPDAALQANLPIGFAFMLLGFLAFAYAYAKGYEGGDGAVEGVRFGVLIAIMLNCFATVWSYVATPISGSLAAAMMVDCIVEFAFYGAIVGAIYKPVPKTARSAAHA